MPIRSYLFAPANHARRAAKSLTGGSDAAILDLEDAVAVSEKPAARDAAVAALAGPRSARAFVRVNAIDTPFCYADLHAVVGPGLDGIVLPKVETAAGLLTIDWLLFQLERERGLPAGGIDLLPIIETARGVADAAAIMRAGSRVRRVAFGAIDYSLDIGVSWSPGEAESRYARDVLVTQSRACGLEPPVDSVFARLGDEPGLRASAQAAAAIGFGAKLCIHPDQVAAVHAAFSPTDAEVAFARRVVDGFAQAEAAGSAAFQIDGKFVDVPVVQRARRVLALADEIAARTP